MRRTIRLFAATVIGVGAAFVLPALPAQAADITVTLADDVVDPMDGLVSLREAIDLANAATEPTTIVLASATSYSLTRCGADEDANVDGDLDYTGAEPLTILGNGATIEQTCAGQRVLQATDSDSVVTIVDATLTGGESFEGAAAVHAGELRLDRVTVAGNDAGAAGSVLSSDSAVTGAYLELVDSTVGPNIGTGMRTSFGTVIITGSTVAHNTGHGAGLVDGALTVSGSLVEHNGGDGLRTTGQGSGLFELSDTVVRDHEGTGVVCSNCGDLEVTGSDIERNQGGGIVVNVDLDPPHDLHVMVTGSSVVDNSRTGPGGGLSVLITEVPDGAPTAQIIITASTFTENAANGAAGRGGAIYAETGEVRVDNSTISGNSAAVTGGGVFSEDGDVFLRHATVVENNAPVGANVGTGEDLDSFASIVALGVGGTDCAVAGTTLSAGYNIGGDDSCAFVAGPGDQNEAGDPLLGSLQDNGGPTLTRLPAADSPALDTVPPAACTAFDVDQRGVARPQGGACESGAVEVAAEEPGGGTPTPSGEPGGDGGGLPITGPQLGGVILAGVMLVAGGAALMAVRRRRDIGAIEG